MDIHKLLKRQLAKANILDNRKPESEEQWSVFLKGVNNVYMEADQERYMLERSMQISSREMMSLNARLETAQRIARLGYWSYDGITDYTIWSKELFTIFEMSPLVKPPNYKKFMSLVYEQDRYELEQKIQKALTHRIEFEYEMRVRDAEGHYHWYRLLAKCREGDRQLEGIIIDIHKNKMADEKIKELNQQIISTARRAGMAEVATTILHNLGNILNSSNISITLLKNNFNQKHQKKLFKILEIIQQHNQDISDFLAHDAKGKIIPEYLLAISKVLLEDSNKNIAEIDSLVNDMMHIRQIVDMQKTVSGVSSINEKIYIPEIIEMALKMSKNTLNNDIVNVEIQTEPCPLIYVDKSKLLQILVNLIKNAKESVLQNSRNMSKEIFISVKKINEISIQIAVEDNGMGIRPDDLQRIFSFGFTTKINGHGFGLHSSAISAKEMGGGLVAKSQGEGCGAQFILTLPVHNNSKMQGERNE